MCCVSLVVRVFDVCDLSRDFVVGVGVSGRFGVFDRCFRSGDLSLELKNVSCD